MKVKWELDDVIGYLEDKILSESATNREIRMYENYKWNNKINKNSNTYKKLINEMMIEYWGKES